MAGYKTYLSLKSTEEQANSFGFRLAHSKYGCRDEDTIALFPKDDILPIYARDAEIYCGTLMQIRSFLAGIQHRDEYLKMIKATSEKKIETVEQQERERRLFETIKHGKEPIRVGA